MPDKLSTATELLPLSADRVARVTGLTRYMVDYLCRTKLLAPTDGARGRGRTRCYTFADLILLRAIARLLKRGISIKELRKNCLSVRERRKSVRDILTRKYLVTDGFRVYWDDDGVLERIDTGQLSFAFVLDLAPIRDEVSRKLGMVG